MFLLLPPTHPRAQLLAAEAGRWRSWDRIPLDTLPFTVEGLAEAAFVRAEEALGARLVARALGLLGLRRSGGLSAAALVDAISGSDDVLGAKVGFPPPPPFFSLFCQREREGGALLVDDISGSDDVLGAKVGPIYLFMLSCIH